LILHETELHQDETENLAGRNDTYLTGNIRITSFIVLLAATISSTLQENVLTIRENDLKTHQR
jgi:hypothetical protein